MISSYQQAKSYLESFINYEKTCDFNYKRSFKLRRVKFLFKQLKILYQKLKVIHIAGTKGKGSTAKFCAQILAASGLRVGLYTSPHLFDFRERIEIVASRSSLPAERQGLVSSKLISKKEVVRIVESFRKKIKRFKLPAQLGKVSFFELYTALALKYFSEQEVDYAVLETGLGGRLDATNVVKPEVALITHIGYDHMHLLGSNLAAIAREKAGIIKNKVPLVCADQARSVLAAISQRCRQKKAPLLLFGRDFKVSRVRLKPKYTLFDFAYGGYKLKDIKITLLGKYQVQNAACALAASFLLNDNQHPSGNFRKSLAEVKFAGRFELVSEEPLAIVDVAHNVSSFAALADNLHRYYGAKKIILIFGCSCDKDARGMLKKVACDKLILTASGNPRAMPAAELKPYAGAKAVVTGNIAQALEEAGRIYKSNSLILVSGSLFLAAEAKKYFQKSPWQFLN